MQKGKIRILTWISLTMKNTKMYEKTVLMVDITHFLFHLYELFKYEFLLLLQTSHPRLKIGVFLGKGFDLVRKESQNSGRESALKIRKHVLFQTASNLC